MNSAPTRALCAGCARPSSVCYCAHVVQLKAQTRVLVLQHPREAERAIGTARIAKLCLPETQIAVGVELGGHPAVQAALEARERRPIVLYPGPRARDLAQDPPDGPVTLIVLDGTWSHARALVRNNRWLLELPQYTFSPTRASEYRIRREPKPHYVSTIEALAEALALLEGDTQRFDALRAPFRAMVSAQVEYAERSRGGRRRERRRDGSRTASRLPSALRSPRLVCLMGEANAWPHDRALGRPPYPHELVQLLLARVDPPDASIELFAAPRAPLASSPIVYSRLSRQQLDSGLTVAQLCERAARFLRSDDVVCTWGPYALGLFLRDGGAVPSCVVDLRKVAGDYLQRSPGTLEETVSAFGLGCTAVGAGRGGERLGMLLALTRHLAERAS